MENGGFHDEPLSISTIIPASDLAERWPERVPNGSPWKVPFRQPLISALPSMMPTVILGCCFMLKEGFKVPRVLGFKGSF